MDEQSNEGPGQNRPPALPPPLKPSNVLDSIFQANGPMPAASIGIRGFAFFLDFVLLSGVSLVIIWKLVMPNQHPGAWYEFMMWIESFMTWMETANKGEGTMPHMSDSLMSALSYAQNLQFIIFWIYFGIGEAFFGGSSLGKRLCCIRSVSTITLGALPIMTGIVRGGLKTTAAFFFFPLSIFIPLLGLLFNKRRQLVHDILSRTAVVDERLTH